MNSNNKNLAALDLNLITALDALLAHQSVTAAAEAVGRTQSAMSHSLARLRDHFRDPILVRDGWAMRLTPFGADLRPRVTAAAQAARAMFETNAPFDPAQTTRRIRIAAPDLCVSLFAGFVRQIAQDAPRASVAFVAGAQARHAVLRAEAEVGLSFGRPKPDANLRLQALPPLAWCSFAPAEHAFAVAPSLETWSAARHILVGQGDAGAGPVEKTAKQHGIVRQAFCYAPNFSAALTLAAETGALLTTLHAPFDTTAARLGLRACPVPFEMPTAAVSLVLRADYGDPFQIWLRDLCLRSLREPLASQGFGGGAIHQLGPRGGV